MSITTLGQQSLSGGLLNLEFNRAAGEYCLFDGAISPQHHAKSTHLISFSVQLHHDGSSKIWMEYGKIIPT